MRIRPGVVLAALLPALLLVGCSNQTPAAAPSPSSSPSSPAPPAAPPTTPPPTSAPSATAPPFPANTQPDTETPVGGQLGLQSATAGRQNGYDRVVFKLGGPAGAKPGWRVEYVTAPTSDGSGNPVAVNGTSFLQVVIRDVGLPGDTGIPDPTTKQLTPAGTVVVKQVVLDTVFEGQYTAFIGVSATLPFRVFRLANPARVVVDVRHS